MNLHIETRSDDAFAFYIDGDLQFDSADEAVYHEGLVLPALCLARQRAGENAALRILICGGGDGLALRECLRFPHVVSVDLVDYSPEVVQLGRTHFTALNDGAFDDPRVSVHIADAWDYLRRTTDRYDVILCDFTVPRRPEDSQVFTREWYAAVRSALLPSGIAALNAVSPQITPEAFWCLRRTVRASGLNALPLAMCIPSFRDHGYGMWGFLLAAPQPLYRAHLRTAVNDAPITAAAVDLPQLWRAAYFTRHERLTETRVPIHCQDDLCLVSLMLNPGKLSGAESTHKDGPPSLDSLLRAIPILHPYHTRLMVEEMAEQVAGAAIRSLDLQRLLNELLLRADRLPAEIRREMERLRTYLSAPGLPPLERWGDWAQRLLAALLLVLTLANLIAPDNAFGKGSFGLGHASVSRSGCSFGRGSGFASGGREGGSFGGGRSGFRSAGSRESSGSFGRSGSFKNGAVSSHVSSARAADFVPDEPIVGRGFRGAYSRREPIDVFGTAYSPRVFYYRPYVYGHTGGYVSNASQPVQEQTARFVADDDLLVLENGDIIVTLSDVAYLVVSSGGVALMQQKSPEPVLSLFPDPGLYDNIRARLQGQITALDKEIGYRQDWLSWVGWTARFSPSVSADAQELQDLTDLRGRIDRALTRLGDGPDAAPPALPGNLADGAIELFVDCGLLSDGRIALLSPDGVYHFFDGATWSVPGQPAQPVPAGLVAILKSILPKLQKEMEGDIREDTNDLATLASDRVDLQKDLAEYTSLASQNGASYEVDYGTDEISASDAINRTNADLTQNAQDTTDTQKDLDKTRGEWQRVVQASLRFGT